MLSYTTPRATIQQLSFHPHIHCIVSGGGITGDNTWKEAKKNTWLFLFPVKAMSIVFRAKFLQSLQEMIAKEEVRLPENTDSKQLFILPSGSKCDMF